MRNYLLAILATAYSVYGFAQKIEVKDVKMEVAGVYYSGMAVDVELEQKLVEGLWSKKLKEICKIKHTKGNYLAEKQPISIINYDSAAIYSRLTVIGASTRVFVYFDFDNDIKAKQRADDSLKVRTWLRDFAVLAYRTDMDNQIEEADKAMNDAVRNYDKLLSAKANNQKRLEKNAAEKIKLEQQLKENAAEKIELEQKIKEQGLELEQKVQDISSLRKIAEEKRAKLTEIK